MGPSVAGMTRDRARRACSTNRKEEDEHEPKDRRRRGRGIPHCHDCPDGGRRAGVPDPQCSGLPHRDLGERRAGSSLGALLQFIGALACTGIALALYPVLRGHNHGLAIGSVGFRTIEGVLHSLIAVCWLLLVTLSQEAARAGAPGSSAYRGPGCVADGRHPIGWPLSRCWPSASGPSATTGSSTSRDSSLDGCRPGAWWPSRWSWCPASSSCSGSSRPSRRPSSSSRLPSAVQEMVLAVWLIAKGFNPRADRLSARHRRSACDCDLAGRSAGAL